MGTYLGAKVGPAEVAIINQRAGHRGQVSLSQHHHCLPLPSRASGTGLFFLLLLFLFQVAFPDLPTPEVLSLP